MLKKIIFIISFVSRNVWGSDDSPMSTRPYLALKADNGVSSVTAASKAIAVVSVVGSLQLFHCNYHR